MDLRLVPGGQALSPGELAAAASLIVDSVARGAALGWVGPPPVAEVSGLLAEITEAAAAGDAALAVALDDAGRALGVGYWRRYARPTHWPQADVERVVVQHEHHRAGIGRVLCESLIAAARAAGIEQLTLDARGDNVGAHALYRELGFTEYGHLSDFVAVGERRYDKTFWVLDLRPGSGPS